MAKLPDPTVLGGVSRGGERRVARFDATSAGRGLEQLGESVGRGQEAIARAVGQGGQEFARAVGQGGEAFAHAVGAGGHAYASAVSDAGQMIGKGEQQLGKGIGDLGDGVLSIKIDRDRFQYAQAHSDFLTQSLQLRDSFAKDTDYATLPQRYGEKLQEIAGNSANAIDDPFMRDRFASTIAPQLAKEQGEANQRARALKTDATIAWTDGQGNTLINATAGSDDPEVRSRAVQSQSALIDRLVPIGDITPQQALAKKQAWAQQFGIADGMERSKTDPQGVINDLRAAPGSDKAVVNRIIQVEGQGANPKSSAAGAGQFTDATWLALIKQKRPDLAQGQSDADIVAMKADKSLARDMVQANLDANRDYLKNAGVPVTPGTLYLAHFLGPKAAAATLQADPNAPIAKVLAEAVGPQMAAAMIQANPKQLLGQQAGTVVNWAGGKMGGADAGGVHVYDILRPDQRELLLQDADTQLRKQDTIDQSGLKLRVEDTIAEADRNGIAMKPVTQSEFVAAKGAVEGTVAFKKYQGDLSFYADRVRVSTMSPQEQQALVAQYQPKEGDPGYAVAADRQKSLVAAINQINNEKFGKDADPAQFAINRLPATSEAFQNFAKASDADRPAAAREYAAAVQLDQDRVGIPRDQQTLLPKKYIDALQLKLQRPTSDGNTSATTATVIEREAKTWGDAWPQVYRQMAKGAAPVALVIGSGVKPVAAQVLSEFANTKLGDIANDESEEKLSTIRKDVRDAFRPLQRSMAGNEGTQGTVDAFQASGEKLAAYYVRQGMTSSDAAGKTFDDLLGHKYDFSAGSYRVPKSIEYTPAQIANGVATAKFRMSELDVAPARDTIGGLPPEYLKEQTSRAYARDGTWVTAPDESGLALVYKDQAVRRGDGSPLVITWGQLAAMGNKGIPEAALGVAAPAGDVP